MTTQLAIKTDLKIKKAAQKQAARQGVTLSLVINAFLERFAKGEFEMRLTSTEKEDMDVTMEELFESEKIIKQANKISEYLSKKSL